MTKFIVIAVLAAALIVPATAGAHGVWYNTAAQTEKNIEWKYPAVQAASCKPVPAWARARYGVDSYIDGTVRVWNHFFCGVYSTQLGGACVALAHLVGQTRSGIVLTSWPYGRGCTTRNLWG